MLKFFQKALILLISSAFIFGIAFLIFPSLKTRIKKNLHLHVQNPQPPFSSPELQTIAPANRLSIRRHMVATLHQALNHGDFKQASFLNSLLSQEAFQRLYRTLKAWEKTRDPATGLVPTHLLPEKKFWTSKDSAADLFCYLWMASRYLDKPMKTYGWMHLLKSGKSVVFFHVPYNFSLHKK